MAADPRVTRVGRWPRASSLDERPQLINVLVGSRSLVGPTPALQHEVAQFDEREDPGPRDAGQTGLCQIEARDNPAFRPYRRLDLYYVQNWSMLLDAWIIVARVFYRLGRGAWLLRSSARKSPAPEAINAATTVLLDDTSSERMVADVIVDPTAHDIAETEPGWVRT